MRKFGSSCIVTKRKNMNGHSISASCIPNNMQPYS